MLLFSVLSSSQVEATTSPSPSASFLLSLDSTGDAGDGARDEGGREECDRCDGAADGAGDAAADGALDPALDAMRDEDWEADVEIEGDWVGALGRRKLVSFV